MNTRARGRTGGSADDHRVVLRPRFGQWLFGICAVVGALLVAQSLAAGYVAETARIAPWLLAFLWVLYVVLVRPSVVLTDARLAVVNVLRRSDLPWDTIEDVVLRYQMHVLLKDGRSVVCWGAPAIGIDRTSGASRNPAGSKVDEVAGVRRMFADHIDDAAPSGLEARSGWDAVGIVGTVIAIVLLVASVL